MEERDERVRALITRLMEAVETSLAGSTAVREALAEFERSGYAPRLFFVADAASRADREAADAPADDEGDGEESAEAPALAEPGVAADGDLGLELTKRDRDFLRSLHIRAEGG